MSVQTALLRFAVLGVPVALLLGMALGPFAASLHGGEAYVGLPRRAARLGHVAAVMLPLLAGFYGLALGSVAHDHAWALWGARLWIPASVLLVLLLFLSAWRPRLRYLLPLPATTLLLAAGAFATALT